MIKGQIFLGGGGSEKDSFLLDKAFVAALDKNKLLLYIPIAIDRRKHPYDLCFEWIKSVFAKFGYGNIVMWTDIYNKTIKDIDEFTAVYIGGGNTFKLLKAFQESGFDKILMDFHKRGGHIYGGSAGAIVLGRNIVPASIFDKNEVDLKDFSGLNLALDYSVFCHYDFKDDKKIEKLMVDSNLRLIALPESGGVVIINNKIKSVGEGDCFVFEIGNKRIIT